MQKEKGYINAIDLAKYINNKYKMKYKSDISSIKLQKSLYFLFAYWGGFVRELQTKRGDGLIETKGADYKQYLFDNRIEAWIYGPVVTDVYHNFDAVKKYDKKAEEEIDKLPIEVKSFIDDMLDDIFEVSDFKLVDLSHSDNCWKKNFVEEDNRHNREILKEEIIDEYSKRKFI